MRYDLAKETYNNFRLSPNNTTKLSSIYTNIKYINKEFKVKSVL